MSSTEQRERAAAALGHVRDAAHEMIAAARDTLDLLDDVVSSADLGEVLNGLNHLTQSVFVRRPPVGDPRPGAAPAPTPAQGPGRPGRPPVRPESDSPVEHISVR